MPLPPKWLGLALVLPAMLSEVCQLGTALTLHHSSDRRMREIVKSCDRVPFRELLSEVPRAKAADEARRAQLASKRLDWHGLKIQATLQKSLADSLTSSDLKAWTTNTSFITPTIANFARKGLLRCLPTNSNLHLWGKSPSSSCPQCHSVETEKHVLNNCPGSAEQGRYTWRHNAVLKLLLEHIKQHIPDGAELLADLPGHTHPSTLYSGIVPDITIVKDGLATILELTCCYETNTLASKARKLEKYRNPAGYSLLPYPFKVLTLEVSSLGFLSPRSLNEFCNTTGITPLQPNDLRRLGEMALRCSFFIFCSRHKPWPIQPSDPFFH